MIARRSQTLLRFALLGLGVIHALAFLGLVVSGVADFTEWKRLDFSAVNSPVGSEARARLALEVFRHGETPAHVAHELLSHVFMILSWWIVPGVLVLLGIAGWSLGRRWGCVAVLAMVVLAWSISFFASFTGYLSSSYGLDLEPPPSPLIGPATRLRFIIIHVAIVPSVLAALVVACWAASCRLSCRLMSPTANSPNVDFTLKE